MVRHISSIAEIVPNMEAAVRFYRETLGVPVEHEPGSPYAVVQVEGVLHFGIWTREAAAESVFGDPSASDRIPLGFTVGFEVDDVEQASRNLEARRWEIAQRPQREPWDQTTSRFFSTSGALCEVSMTPSARQLSQNVQGEPGLEAKE